MQLARNALRDAVATSPLSGIVAKRHVQPGEKVAFDSPLVTIVDLKDMELQAMVPAIDVPELSDRRRRSSSRSTASANGAFRGRVERINPSTEPGTRAFLVYVGIPNQREVLRGGMFATGRIAIAAQAPTPTLPLRRSAPKPARPSSGRSRTGSSSRRNVMLGRARRKCRPRRAEDGAARGPADPRQQVRQPQGRRAGAGQGRVELSGEACLTDPASRRFVKAQA